MPPRKRKKKAKLSEEQLKENYEKWKAEEDGEYALIKELDGLVQELGLTNLSELDPDLTVKIQKFLPVFQRIGQVFKVKKSRKLKPIKQVHIRTCFFGGKHLSNFLNSKKDETLPSFSIQLH